MPWYFWVGLPLAVLFIAIVVMYLIGRAMRPDHVTAAAINLRQPPDEVYDLITNVGEYPSWSRITKVTRLPDDKGRPAWRQHFGGNSVVTIDTRADRPRTYQQTIADDHKFFSGTWTYTIHPTLAGCKLELVEHGTVHYAIPRFMMHYLADPAVYLKRQLLDIAAQFDEAPTIERITPPATPGAPA